MAAKNPVEAILAGVETLITILPSKYFHWQLPDVQSTHSTVTSDAGRFAVKHLSQANLGRFADGQPRGKDFRMADRGHRRCSAAGRSVRTYASRVAREEQYCAVVLVDAARFALLCRSPQSSHRDVAILDEATWPTDYIYQEAVDRFSRGAENPVPLAEMSCGVISKDVFERHQRFLRWTTDVMVARQGEVVLDFTNEIKQTIFSLANGAVKFSVRWERNAVVLLCKLAGSSNHPPMLLSSLKQGAEMQDWPRYSNDLIRSPHIVSREFFRPYGLCCRSGRKRVGFVNRSGKKPAHLAPEY